MNRDRAKALIDHWRSLAAIMPPNPARTALLQCAAELEAAADLDDAALAVVAPEIPWKAKGR